MKLLTFYFIKRSHLCLLCYWSVKSPNQRNKAGSHLEKSSVVNCSRGKKNNHKKENFAEGKKDVKLSVKNKEFIIFYQVFIFFKNEQVRYSDKNIHWIYWLVFKRWNFLILNKTLYMKCLFQNLADTFCLCKKINFKL